MVYSLSLRRMTLAVMTLTAASVANAELQALEEQEMRAVTGGSALQYSATDISYGLSQLVGVQYTDDGAGGYTREEKRTVTERVDATVHRVQINGDGEFHAYGEELAFGDYGGTNNSIYKTADGQGISEIGLRNFGFGTSASNPFYFEDPYIEIQKQNHADGTQSLRGIRIGFGRVEGTTPVSIDSVSGYVQTLSLLPDLNGLIPAQVYGSGTKDTFVNTLGEIPDGTGNYPQNPEAGAGVPNNTTGPLQDALGENPGGKELNLEHVVSLDFHNLENFYISMTQGGGNSMVNSDGSVNGALWSQHLQGIIPQSRSDLPGWNMVAPFNDAANPTAGYVEAHTNTAAAMSQILLGIGDDNPRQSYEPVF